MSFIALLYFYTLSFYVKYDIIFIDFFVTLKVYIQDLEGKTLQAIKGEKI